MNDVEAKPTSEQPKSDFYLTFFTCLFLGMLGVHRFCNKKIGSGVLQLVTCGGLGIWWFVDLLVVLLGKFKDKNGVAIQNINPKMSWAVAAVVVVIGIAGGSANSGTGAGAGGGDSTTSPSTALDPDPSGTWTAGDRNSVYSRLVVSSSGIFSFETVDFTGDVKGGYSGSWELNGTSIRFKWDGGSCSGRRSGKNSLVFGSTTFRK